MVIFLMLFRGKIDLTGDPAKVLDMTLAISVAIFFLMFTAAISVGATTHHKPSSSWNRHGWMKIMLSLLTLGMIIAMGLRIMKFSETETVIPIAVATLGVLTTAAGCVVSYFSMARSF